MRLQNYNFSAKQTTKRQKKCKNNNGTRVSEPRCYTSAYGRLLYLGVLLERPVLAVFQTIVLALEHLGTFLAALQLPVKPSQGHHCELTTMRFAIGSAMTNGKVGSTSRHVVDLVEVVHTIAIGDILWTT